MIDWIFLFDVVLSGQQKTPSHPFLLRGFSQLNTHRRSCDESLQGDATEIATT